nr:acetate kinase [Naematelia aurantialba]
MYLLAVNCGSSSIKGKLFALPSSISAPLEQRASLSVTGIGSHGDKVNFKVNWEQGHGKAVDEDGDDGASVDYEELFPQVLDKLTASSDIEKDDIQYVSHRVVHGATHKSGIRITKDHTEGLQEMDKLSTFAPLHNHHAVLAVRACLNALPDHTSLLLFDTLFHQTIPPETYTYALPPPDQEIVMPLRKYGFHGLSYASIVHSLAEHLQKRPEDVNVVVAHLGSGASSCCIRGGKSIDTSMGLTPLEGLIGGTRSGTVDPTAIFHHTKDPGADAGIEGLEVSQAEAVLNKKSGLLALAGTTNMGTILKRIADPLSCSSAEHYAAVLAYGVFLDRLMGYVSQYMFKLLASVPKGDIDGIVFSGGIGEKAVQLRKDVLEKFGWLGAEIDEQRNQSAKGEVREITKDGSAVRGWVVETDEEGWCAHMTREEFGF